MHSAKIPSHIGPVASKYPWVGIEPIAGKVWEGLKYSRGQKILERFPDTKFYFWEEDIGWIEATPPFYGDLPMFAGTSLNSYARPQEA